jgi:hypothetical protein
MDGRDGFLMNASQSNSPRLGLDCGQGDYQQAPAGNLGEPGRAKQRVTRLWEVGKKGFVVFRGTFHGPTMIIQSASYIC